MKELSSTLIDTVQKAELSSLVEEYAELGIDAMTTSPILGKIPLVGSVVSIAKAGISLRDVLFVKSF